MDAFFPEALAGFIMVVTEEGDMIFLTENVNKHIGIAQVQHVSWSSPETVFTVNQLWAGVFVTRAGGLFLAV